MATVLNIKVRKLDKYDRDIAFFKKHPDKIQECWGEPGLTRKNYRHSLFQRLSKVKFDNNYGCPTQIKGGGFIAEDSKLEDMVKKLTVFPKYPWQIKFGHLRSFAKIQRAADKLLGRK